jgi:hypothetical protein
VWCLHGIGAGSWAPLHTQSWKWKEVVSQEKSGFAFQKQVVWISVKSHPDSLALLQLGKWLFYFPSSYPLHCCGLKWIESPLFCLWPNLSLAWLLPPSPGSFQS